MVNLPDAAQIAESAIWHRDIPFNLIHYTMFTPFPALDGMLYGVLSQDVSKRRPILSFETMICEEYRLIVPLFTLSVKQIVGKFLWCDQ